MPNPMPYPKSSYIFPFLIC